MNWKRNLPIARMRAEAHQIQDFTDSMDRWIGTFPLIYVRNSSNQMHVNQLTEMTYDVSQHMLNSRVSSFHRLEDLTKLSFQLKFKMRKYEFESQKGAI